MTKGKIKTNYLHREGIVSLQTQPDYGFLYELSKIKAPKWNVSDIVEPGNGKGFVYCKSGGACYTGLGNILYNAIPATGIDYALIPYAAAIGAKSVILTNQGVVAQTLDGLRGGTILFKIATGSDDSELQCRGIIGNTAGGISDEITIYLDAPLTSALTAASYAYCMPSPYSDVRYSDNPGRAAESSHVGFAAAYVSAANVYHWEQFKGRIMGVSLYGNPGTAGDDHKRGLVWRYQGSLQYQGTDATGGLNQQQAGYIMDNNWDGNGATEVMLTGNV